MLMLLFGKKVCHINLRSYISASPDTQGIFENGGKEKEIMVRVKMYDFTQAFNPQFVFAAPEWPIVRYCNCEMDTLIQCNGGMLYVSPTQCMSVSLQGPPGPPGPPGAPGEKVRDCVVLPMYSMNVVYRIPNKILC